MDSGAGTDVSELCVRPVCGPARRRKCGGRVLRSHLGVCGSKGSKSKIHVRVQRLLKAVHNGFIFISVFN